MLKDLSQLGRRLAPGCVVLAFSTVALAQGKARKTPMQAAPPPATSASGAAPVASPGHRNTADLRLARLALMPGGWTAEQVAQRARTSSYDVAAKHEALRAAAARVDQALLNFVPRLTGTARYTRLSPVDGASFGSLVTPPPGFAGPGLIPAGTPLFAVPLGFPSPPLNSYTIQASLAVPISDYFLRISRAHAAATHSEEAARLDKLASEAKAYSDAKLAFYNWVKAIGQREVLQQAVTVAQEHARDAEALFKAGQASKADVMAVQAQVAQGELVAVQTEEFVKLAEEQLRLMVRAAPDEVVALGEDVSTEVPKMQLDSDALRREALSTRAEMRALAAGEQGLEKVTALQRAQAWPQIVAFGDLVYANPNQRVFPQTNKWAMTWDVGLQLTWSPNDLLSTTSVVSEAESNAAKLRAQRAQVRDGISLEVTQAVLAVKTAETNLETTNVAMAASEEAYRVRRELYRVGKATSSELSDAENNLFRARLVALGARLDQRIARVRLEHATGRDLARLGPRLQEAGDGRLQAVGRLQLQPSLHAGGRLQPAFQAGGRLRPQPAACGLQSSGGDLANGGGC